MNDWCTVINSTYQEVIYECHAFLQYVHQDCRYCSPYTKHTWGPHWPMTSFPGFIFPSDTIQLCVNSGGEIKGTINPGTIMPVMAASFGKIPKLEKKSTHNSMFTMCIFCLFGLSGLGFARLWNFPLQITALVEMVSHLVSQGRSQSVKLQHDIYT